MPASQTTAKAAPAVRAPTVTGRGKVAPATKGRPGTASPQPSKVPGKPSPAPSKAAAQPAPSQPATEDTLEQRIGVQPKTYEPRLGLARTLHRRLNLLKDQTSRLDTDTIKSHITQIEKHYLDAIVLCPRNHDAYIELGAILEQHVSLDAVADLYGKFPFERTEQLGTSQDDLYIDSEITRIYMKLKRYKDPVLIRSLIAEGREMGIGILSKHMETLDAASESKTLREVYAGVNRKQIDDPDMVAFFKMKYWM
ncbi:hypothetical protein PhCBS80983_g02259 [Powellomyces hirtus]|uniref:Uncharacterized protein n=1 Tax=Powellomyces hirtus TaxID=109895 RepID=A0A507E8L6_9FUNG|nr:hypothetical protein PhCBS80983_g02259 [Powellomyces hirtus]